MDKRQNLTEGKILNKLLTLALPVVGTQLIQLTYNLTDMFWLGRVGSGAVAASGTAGLFIWLSVGFMLIGSVGAQIGVSQSKGRGDEDAAREYAQGALFLAVCLGLFYGVVLAVFRRPLVGFFNFQEAAVAADTEMYLAVMAAGVPLTFISAAVSGAFAASGNTRTPFYINGCGLAINVALDPVLIFALDMGVAGAALASVFAQAVVCALTLIAVKRSKKRPFERFSLAARPKKARLAQIFKWTTPIFIENSAMCLLTMVTSRFEVAFGAYAVAMSRVGSQIGSLTWLVGSSFGSALTAFVGQNFGAGKRERIDAGVRVAAVIMAGWGVFVTALMFFAGGPIFALFLPDPALTALGVSYLRIVSYSQLPQNIAAVPASAFKGTGRTVPPSVASAVTSALRVPLAYALSLTPLGLLGIWAGGSIAAGLNGVWICAWYVIAEGRRRRKEARAEKPAADVE